MNSLLEILRLVLLHSASGEHKLLLNISAHTNLAVFGHFDDDFEYKQRFQTYYIGKLMDSRFTEINHYPLEEFTSNVKQYLETLK